jgi:hypothetical protein
LEVLSQTSETTARHPARYLPFSFKLILS